MTSTREISVGLMTHSGAPHLSACLAALGQQSWREVLVVDRSTDGRRLQPGRDFDTSLPLRVLHLPAGASPAAGRNEIARACATPYLLLIDDDQRLPANVGRLAEVLDENPVIGGVAAVGVEAGRRTCEACDMRMVGSKVVTEVCAHHPVRHTSLGQRYVTFDVVPTPTLFRTACLAELGWDVSSPVGGEQFEFFFLHQRLGRWQFAVSLDVVVERCVATSAPAHRDGKGKAASARHLREKFGVSRVVTGRRRDAWASLVEGPPAA